MGRLLQKVVRVIVQPLLETLALKLDHRLVLSVIVSGLVMKDNQKSF